MMERRKVREMIVVPKDGGKKSEGMGSYAKRWREEK